MVSCKDIQHGSAMEKTHSASSGFAQRSQATGSVPSSGIQITTPRQDENRRCDDMHGLLDAVFLRPDGYESLSSASEGGSDHSQLEIHDT